MNIDLPCLLYPVRLETRLVETNQDLWLWVRIFPDKVISTSLQATLTDKREQISKLRREFLDSLEADKKEVWRKIVEEVGVPLGLLLTDNRNDDKSWDTAETVKYLPNQFVIYCKTDEGSKKHHAEIIDRERIIRGVDQKDSWLNNFEEAVQVGLGAKIKIDPRTRKVYEVIAVGLVESDPNEAVETLLQAQLYSNDFSVLEYGAPTNNTSTKKANYNPADRNNAEKSYPRVESSANSDTHFDGKRLEASLGLSPRSLNRAKYLTISDYSVKVDAIRKATRAIVWASLGEKVVKMFFKNNTLSPELLGELRDHFINYVDGHGILPAIQIGSQPYGILPVLAGDIEPNSFTGKLSRFLNHLNDRWAGIDEVPKLGKDPENSDEELLQALSMQPQSTSYQWRTFKVNDKIENEYSYRRDPNTGAIVGINPASEAQAEYTRVFKAWSELTSSFVDLDKLDDTLAKLIPIDFARREILIADEGLWTKEVQEMLNRLFTEAEQGNAYGSLQEPEPTNSLPSTLHTFLLHYLNKIGSTKTEDDLKLLKVICSEFLVKENWLKNKDIISNALFEALDLHAYRLDAWITSIANRRLSRLRGDQPRGIHLAAYGYVENIARNPENTNAYKNSFVHAPSTKQAIAAAVTKSAFLTHLDESETNPFALNITSDRVQKSIFLQEGIRNGQSISALLGYELEKKLSANPQVASAILPLREIYPLVVASSNFSNDEDAAIPEINAIDGFALLSDFDANANLIRELNIDYGERDQDEQAYCNELLKGIVQKVKDSLDASLDTLMYEAAYQSVSGNYPRAAAAMNAFNTEKAIPKLESIKTPVDTIGITHKFALLFSDTPHKIIPSENPKGAVEPVMEKWLADQLGDIGEIELNVSFFRRNEEGEKLSVQDFGMSTKVFLRDDEDGPDLRGDTVDKLKDLDLRGVTSVEQVIAKYKAVHGYEALENDEKVNLDREFEKLALHTFFFNKKQESASKAVAKKSSIEFKLAELKQHYQDILYLCTKGLNTGSSPFDLLVRAYLRDVYSITEDLFLEIVEESNNEIYHLFEVNQVIKKLFGFGKRIKQSDFVPAYYSMDNEKSVLSAYLREKITESTWLASLNKAKGILLRTSEDLSNIEELSFPSFVKLSRYNLETLYQVSGSNGKWRQNLKAEISKRIASYDARKPSDEALTSVDDLTIEYIYELFEGFEKAAQALFGDEFMLLPPIPLPVIEENKKPNKEQLSLIGDFGQERIQRWMQEISQVNHKIAAFEHMQMELQVFNSSTIGDNAFQVWQYIPESNVQDEDGNAIGYFPWVALSKEEIKQVFIHKDEKIAQQDASSFEYPKGATSLVFYGQENMNLSGGVGYTHGLVIDSFPEFIPQQTVETGISFNYDAPNSEAPQALLLAVPGEQLRGEWTADELKVTVVKAINLAKKRMIDPEAMRGLGYLFPATFIKPPKRSNPRESSVKDISQRFKVLSTDLDTWDSPQVRRNNLNKTKITKTTGQNKIKISIAVRRKNTKLSNSNIGGKNVLAFAKEGVTISFEEKVSYVKLALTTGGVKARVIAKNARGETLQEITVETNKLTARKPFKTIVINQAGVTKIEISSDSSEQDKLHIESIKYLI